MNKLLHSTGLMLPLALAGLAVASPVSGAPAAATGDLHRDYDYLEAGRRSPYRLYVPTTYDPKRAYPLVVMLHGGGSDENEMFENTDIRALAEARGVIVVAPLGYPSGGGYGNFFPIVTTAASKQQVIAMTGNQVAGAPKSVPQPAAQARSPSAAPEAYIEMPGGLLNDPKSAEMSEHDVLNVVKQVQGQYHVDAKRIYLTGNSMGGCGTQYLAARYPEIWAAAASAGCLVGSWAYPFRRLKDAHLAIMYIHGEFDHHSNPRWAKALSKTAADNGVETEYLMVPGGTHGSAYSIAMPQILDFLLRHSKG